MKRTGVILGIDPHTPEPVIATMIDQLEARFPNVTFAIIPDAHSVTFEYDDTKPEPAGDYYADEYELPHPYDGALDDT